MCAVSKKVIVPVANGSEEAETVIIVDVLRRSGAEVVLASVEESLEVTCSRNVKLVADAFLSDCVSGDYDAVALPVRH